MHSSSRRPRGKSFIAERAARPAGGFKVASARIRLDLPLSLRPTSDVILSIAISPLSLIERKFVIRNLVSSIGLPLQPESYHNLDSLLEKQLATLERGDSRFFHPDALAPQNKNGRIFRPGRHSNSTLPKLRHATLTRAPGPARRSLSSPSSQAERRRPSSRSGASIPARAGRGRRRGP